MPTEVLQKQGTQLIFADHATDFAPAAANSLEQGTPTDVQMQMASIATGSAVNSNKVDLGATRASQFSVMAAIEFAATPSAGGTVDFFWAPSPDSTNTDGNPGGVDGTDGAYTGTAASTVAESVKQLDRIGSFICTDDATGTVQIAKVGILFPSERYGTLVIVNSSGASTHSDDAESHVAITPIIDEIQN